MNAKNLLLKFAFVGLLVVVSVWSLWTNRLRLGIDLRGGHSLVFEIRTNEAEAQRLREMMQRLQEQLKTAAQDQQAEIQESIQRVQNEMQRYERATEEEGDLAGKMIAILKRRVDPQGLRSLEWRPQGQSRIEIRMPAASGETQQARYLYVAALEDLEKSNLQRSQIRRIVQAPPDQRAAEIAATAGEDSELAGRLAELAQAYDATEQARAALNVAATADQRKIARAALDDAEFAYETLLERILRTSIDLQGLQTVLGNYVPPAEQRAMGNVDEVRRRQRNFDRGVKAVLDRYPRKRELIQRVVGAYQAWAQGRQRLEDPSDLKRLIAKAGVLEFRIAPFSPSSEAQRATVLPADLAQRYLQSLMNEGPEALRRRNERFLWFPTREDPNKLAGLVTGDYQGQTYVLLANTPENTLLHDPGAGGWSLTRAGPTVDQQGRPAVAFTFNEAGARRFNHLTGAHVGEPLAVLLDDEMYSAPIIQTAISAQGIITGNFTPDEVRELSRTLEAGSLPARLNSNPVAENTFGPGIGEENLKQALRAGWISLIVVIAFMFIYYLKAGLLADAAMLLNLLLVLGAMSFLNAVFTLPGIAGVILTIGMAVDANVLIYERLREEQQKGQSPRMAVKNAYERAFSAILDSNLTTLITSVILGWVATEEVKGFAITLGLGVLFNLFTAVVVTRWFLQLMLDRGWLVKPLRMMKVIGVPNINWMAKRYLFWTLSGALTVMGVVSLIWQGKDIWGIEFSSGTQVMINFRGDALVEGQLPTDRLVERRVIDQARGEGLGRFVATARVEKIIDPNRIRRFLQTYAGREDAQQISLEDWTAHRGNPAFFEQLDANSDGVLSRAELQDRLPAAGYQVTTTETNVSVIRRVISEAFGPALVQRSKIDHRLLADSQEAPGLGINVSQDGMTRIDSRLLRSLNPEFRQELIDYEGGLLMVISHLDPPIGRDELLQRIREMRFQPDFSAQQLNQTTALGLGASQNGDYPTFVVAVLPADPAVAQDAAAWDKFAAGEAALLKEALSREEALVATNFDPAIAGEIAQSAIVAVILSWAAIIAYLWLRFGSSRWGLAAVICLVHDVTIAVGLVAVSGWLSTTIIGRALMIDSFKIDLALVAAFLTVIGYSVNDTIVIFDRIRENRGKLATVTSTVINSSINQTLSRTLLTGTTTLLVIIIMYIWGGQGIRAFNFVLLAGIVCGTYSSIAVASPMLLGFRRAILSRVAPGPAAAEARR